MTRRYSFSSQTAFQARSTALGDPVGEGQGIDLAAAALVDPLLQEHGVFVGRSGQVRGQNLFSDADCNRCHERQMLSNFQYFGDTPPSYQKKLGKSSTTPAYFTYLARLYRSRIRLSGYRLTRSQLRVRLNATPSPLAGG